MTEIDELGNDPEQLRAENIELRKLLAQAQERTSELEQIVAHLRKLVFGARSERHTDGGPLLPFPGDEEEPPPPPHVNEAADEEYEAVRRKRSKRGINRLPADLPRERVVIELPEDERRCPNGCVMQPIGEEVTEELDYVPAVLRIREIVRIKYACRQHEEGGVATPELPPRPIPKGMAAAGLIAQVMVAKYKDHLPLYRQHRIFLRHGVDIGESTMGDWIRLGAELLEPIVQAMKNSILESDVIHTDDTGIKVQDPTIEKGIRKGYLWAYVGDRNEVVFDFTQGRSRDGPLRFLGDYRGYMQADAYSGYDAIFRTGKVVEVGCWAHARRRFFDALKTDKEHASDALAAIRELYHIERQAREHSLDANMRHQLRQQESKPVTDAMNPWLLALQPKVLPKSPLGKAIGYAVRQWDALTRYLEDGRLAIDNNVVEREMRALAVGRKNWLFAGSDDGARRAAIIYSLVNSCALVGAEPWAYLRDALNRLAADPDQAPRLTPRLWKQAQPKIEVV